MTISRWKLMASFLGLSVGGLAMCCAQTTPVAPVAPKIDLPAPSLPSLDVKPTAEKEIEILLPVLPPAKSELVPVVAEEKKSLDIPPLSGNYEPPAPPKSEKKDPPAPKPSSPPPAISGLDLSPAPAKSEPAKLEPKPAPIALDTVKTPEPIKVAEPTKVAPPSTPLDFETPKAPAKLIVKEVPATKVTPKPDVSGSTHADISGSKLKMLLRMGNGTPRFEIRSTTSEELLFKVYGDKIEMQANPDGGKGSPLAGVTASGKVRFTGPGVEGTCDSLTLLSGTGEVLMKGNVQLKTKTGRAWSELAAEKMMYQIGMNGLKATSAAVTPTSFRE